MPFGGSSNQTRFEATSKRSRVGVRLQSRLVLHALFGDDRFPHKRQLRLPLPQLLFTNIRGTQPQFHRLTAVDTLHLEAMSLTCRPSRPRPPCRRSRLRRRRPAAGTSASAARSSQSHPLRLSDSLLAAPIRGESEWRRAVHRDETPAENTAEKQRVRQQMLAR